MAKTCPDCGAAMEFESRPASILLGTCPDCSHAFTLVEGTATPSSRTGPTPGPEASSGEAGDRPTCDACGSSLSFRESDEGRIESVCPGCHATARYVLASDRTDTEGGPGSPRRYSGGPSRFDSSRTRPCRECGGPLTFTSLPDGTVEGRCGSCGNRFTLPARREGGGFGRGGRGVGRPGGSYRGGGSYAPRGAREGGARFAPRGRRPFSRGSDRGDTRFARRKRTRRSDSDDTES